MIEVKVQEKTSDSNVTNDSKIPRQDNGNVEPFKLNGKATFILYFPFDQQPKIFQARIEFL